MEGKKNLSQEEVLEISKVFTEQPLFSKIIITLNSEYEKDDLDLSNNVMSEFQYIVAVGEQVKSVVPGDMVRINIDKMTKREVNPNNSHETITSIQLSPVVYGENIFAIIEDRLIQTKFNNKQTLHTDE
jgi:hypothetical protein